MKYNVIEWVYTQYVYDGYVLCHSILCSSKSCHQVPSVSRCRSSVTALTSRGTGITTGRRIAMLEPSGRPASTALTLKPRSSISLPRTERSACTCDLQTWRPTDLLTKDWPTDLPTYRPANLETDLQTCWLKTCWSTDLRTVYKFKYTDLWSLQHCGRLCKLHSTVTVPAQRSRDPDLQSVLLGKDIFRVEMESDSLSLSMKKQKPALEIQLSQRRNQEWHK